MSNVSTMQDTAAYRLVECEYMALLKEYRTTFGLAAALKINDRLTLGAWHDDPAVGRIKRLIDRMKMDLAQEDLK